MALTFDTNYDFLRDRVILITGGTGSFGQALTRYLIAHAKPAKIIILSRDELKQYEMQQHIQAPNLRFFLGDVRDGERLQRAFTGVDYIVHAAALKQVPAAEYNPFEAVKTNVLGAQNVINAAIDRSVKRVVALSTDKAANPINLYGATKLCSDKLFIAGNAYVGASHKTLLFVVRYGNVAESRGSVIPHFRKLAAKGVLPITDKRMTRFYITLDEAVPFVLDVLKHGQGGEIFVPKIPSFKVVDLAKAIAPKAKLEFVGIRSGEKLHEVMVPVDEAHQTVDLGDRYAMLPAHGWVNREFYGQKKRVGDGFCYSSDANKEWLSVADLRERVKQV